MLGFMHHLNEQRKLKMGGTCLVLRMPEERARFQSLGGAEVMKVALGGLGLLPSVKVLVNPTSTFLTCSSQVFRVSGAVPWSVTLYAIEMVLEHGASGSGHFW